MMTGIGKCLKLYSIVFCIFELSKTQLSSVLSKISVTDLIKSQRISGVQFRGRFSLLYQSYLYMFILVTANKNHFLFIFLIYVLN